MLNHVEIIPNSFNQYESYYYISYLVDKQLIIFDHFPMLMGLISDSTHTTPWKRDRIAKWSLFSTWWSSTCRIFCGKKPFYFAGRIPMDFTGGFPPCHESCSTKVLQDLRCAVATPEFEARLAEMRKVGEARTWEGIELGSPQQKLEKGRFLKLVACWFFEWSSFITLNLSCGGCCLFKISLFYLVFGGLLLH